MKTVSQAVEDKASGLIELHEGRRRLPYRDTVGKLTIGIGFNLDDVGLYDEEIDFILRNRINRVDLELRTAFKETYTNLNTVRKVALIDMAYNLGIIGIAKFHKMWQALEAQDYRLAATNMLDSKWATQVKGRATRLAQMMRTGEWE